MLERKTIVILKEGNKICNSLDKFSKEFLNISKVSIYSNNKDNLLYFYQSSKAIHYKLDILYKIAQL